MCVEQAMYYGKIGVSFSGGKDSLVLLDLVRRVIPDAPAAMFDSGCELRQTYDVLEYYAVDIIESRLGLIEMCRHGGYWGYETPVDPDATFDFDEILVYEPARRFVSTNNLDVVALGLRGEESTGRYFNSRIGGELYYAKGVGVWHLTPLAFWSVADIWAYIASQGLEYNRAYDKLAELGVPRERQRISTILGSVAAAFGRYVYLKKIDPDLWNRLAAEFPKIRSYT